MGEDVHAKFWPALLDTEQPVAPQLDAVRNRVVAHPASPLAFDIETNGPAEERKGGRDSGALDMRKAEIVGISLGWPEPTHTPWPAALHNVSPGDTTGKQYPSVYVPLRHGLVPPAPPEVWGFLRQVLGDAKRVKVVHNQPFDVPMLHWRGELDVNPPVVDTALMEWVYDETLPRKLKTMGETLLGWRALEYNDLAAVPFGSLPPNVAFRYGCQDVYLPLRLTEFFRANTHPAGLALLRDFEMPIQDLFTRVHYIGVDIDEHLRRRYEAAAVDVASALRKKIEAVLGGINVNAPAQLRAAFQSRFGLALPNAQALTLKRVFQPVEARVAARAVLEYKKWDTLLKTFIVGLGKEMWPDGKIHSRYLQWFYQEGGKGKSGARSAGAKTGRSSSQGPNEQNTPRRSYNVPLLVKDDVAASTRALGEVHPKRLRVAPDGWSFVSADASKLEVRTEAMVTGEPILVHAFRNGLDNVYGDIGRAALSSAGLSWYVCEVPVATAAEATVCGYGTAIDMLRDEHTRETGHAAWTKGPVVALPKGGVEYECFKRIVLGTGYGAGPDTVHAQLEKDDILVDPSLVKRLYDMVQGQLPTLTGQYPNWVRDVLSRHGWCETVFGRRRHFPKFHSRDRGMIREAVNFLVGQSPGFDLIKRAMLEIDVAIREYGMCGMIVGQVHDEVIVCCPDAEVDRMAHLLHRAISNPEPTKRFPYPVPMDADVAVGKNLGDKRPYRVRGKWSPNPAIVMLGLRTQEDMDRFKSTVFAYAVTPIQPEVTSTVVEAAVAPEVAQAVEVPPDAPDVPPSIATSSSDGVNRHATPEAVEIAKASPMAEYRSLVGEVIPCVKCEHFTPWGHRKVGPLGCVTRPVTLVWVGANPGLDELDQRQVFVGRSGSVLKLQAYRAGLPMPPQDDCLVCNALWCGSDRTDGITGVHIKNCRPYLERLLAIARPKIIVALGSVAARAVLRGGDASVESMLGWNDSPVAKVFVNYHPAFVLRSPGYTHDFFTGLLAVKAEYDKLTKGSKVTA